MSDLWEMFKKSFFPFVPEEASQEVSEDNKVWEAFKKGNIARIKSTPLKKNEPIAESRRIKENLFSQDFVKKFAKKDEKALFTGSIQIDKTLDLHGMGQEEAYNKSLAFIQYAYEKGRRVLLIITGKGRMGRGVLKQNFPRWLGQKKFRKYIMRFEIAHVKQGGEGAYYLFLRRNKTEKKRNKNESA